MLSSTFCLFQLENYLNSGNPRWRYQVELIKFRFAPLCCALFVNKLNTQSYMFSLPHATSPCIFALWFIAHKAPPSCPFPCKLSIVPSTPILPLLSPFSAALRHVVLERPTFCFPSGTQNSAVTQWHISKPLTASLLNSSSMDSRYP